MNAEETVPHPLHPGGHPSRMALGRLLSGDCDPAARAALESHIASCAHCGRVFENARLDADDFARRRPNLESLDRRRSRVSRVPGDGSADARGLVRKLLQALDRGFGMRPGLAGIAGLAVLVLASVVGVLQWRAADGTDSQASDLSAKGNETESKKGNAKFLAYLNGNPWHGDTLACAPKDTLQLFIVADAPVHYAVLYRDDGGPLMPYMSSREGKLPLKGSPRGEALPHSLILGEGWARETIYCVSSSLPFTLIEAEQAVALADRAAKGPVTGGIRVQMLFLANKNAAGRVIGQGNGGP